MTQLTVKSADDLGKIISITDNQLVNGRLFRRGEQYFFKAMRQETRSCGCPGGNAQMINVYVVEVGGVDYAIDGRYALQTRELNGVVLEDVRNKAFMAPPPLDENGQQMRYDDFGNEMPDGTVFPNNYNPSGELARFNKMAAMNMRRK